MELANAVQTLAEWKQIPPHLAGSTKEKQNQNY